MNLISYEEGFLYLLSNTSNFSVGKFSFISKIFLSNELARLCKSKKFAEFNNRTPNLYIF